MNEQEAKAAVGYRDRVEPQPVCSRCRHFTVDLEHRTIYCNWDAYNVNGESVVDREYDIEKHPRCSLGGFPVRRRGTCRLFEVKP
jgi:hypothetical protein